MPSYMVALLGKYLCLRAARGRARPLSGATPASCSLGHGAFFALGGYAMGMHLMREIGDRGVYANPELPDFMVFLSYTELPWFWHGFDMFWFACLMVLLVPGLLAFVFGWFAFRSRVTGVYLSIITQALTYRADARLLPQRDGLRRQQRPDRLPRRARLPALGRHHAGGALRALGAGAGGAGSCSGGRSPPRSSARCWWRCATPRAARASSATGSSTTSSSSSRSRRCSPGSPARSTCRRSASSTRASSRPANSIEIVIWVALGGRGTLVGAALGALIVAAAKSWLTAALARGLALRARRDVRPGDDLPAEGRARADRGPRAGGARTAARPPPRRSRRSRR